MQSKQPKQVAKGAKGKKQPRKKGSRKCRICGTCRGLMKQYGLHICRRCFRECAEDMGFSKF